MKGKMYRWRGKCIDEGVYLGFRLRKLSQISTFIDFLSSLGTTFPFSLTRLQGVDFGARILGPGFWGRCVYEAEDVFMKRKMYLWRWKYVYEGEDVFMKGEMYRWRGISGFQNQEAKSNQSTYLYLSLLIFTISIFCLFLSSLGITFLFQGPGFREWIWGASFWGPDFGARISGTGTGFWRL